jgi:LPS sulfotransferase NodH
MDREPALRPKPSTGQALAVFASPFTTQAFGQTISRDLPMSNQFLVVCQARTGSTMLSTALQRHPEICAHGEVLNLRSDDRLEFYGLDYNTPGSIIDYLRQMLRRSPDEYIDQYVFFNGRFKSVGFKFKYEELSNPLFLRAREYVLRRRDLKIIHMTRQNIWKRFLSEYIALNVTHVFNSVDKPIEVPPTTFHLDINVISDALEKTLQWQTQFRRLFYSHDSIDVTYESFTDNPNSEFKRVTDFLNVSPHNFFPSTKKIHNNQSVEQLIENYSEIKNHFSNTKFAHLFIENF